MVVSTCDESTDFNAHVSVLSELACVDENDDSCGAQSIVAWLKSSGTEYYVPVHGFGVDTGRFVISFQNGDGGSVC